ncbi:hypothetical protein LSH36_447g02029 [Paralvinella palmiformis]|uniref:Sec20 C-terminal domain-containing protein n=1 Tax=Paralvinella palmiformis TaxID=53620 RepID=A0AAD9N0A2_9ANNE|nr:hypothetical protein LSH36_447g02029 [Paralvinella palmiformis]
MASDVQVKICQQDIIRLDLEIKALIQDTRKCTQSTELLQDLNQSIQKKLLDLKKCIKDLERLAREQERETDTIGILREVENHKKQLSSVQVELRRAYVASQLAIEKYNREQLYAGTSTFKKSISSKEQAAQAATNVTEQLMTISRRMAAQVKQGQDTVSTLATSSRQINQTQDEFKNMASHIQNSQRLLTRYGRRECTDKILIVFAIMFFFAAVLYIIKKRLFSVS